MAEQFLYVFTPGDRAELAQGPEAWTDQDRAVAGRHADHLRRGADQGIVLLAGRCQDWLGPAIVILETASESEARQFMEADPFVHEGLFGAELHPFRTAFRSG